MTAGAFPEFHARAKTKRHNNAIKEPTIRKTLPPYVWLTESGKTGTEIIYDF